MDIRRWELKSVQSYQNQELDTLLKDGWEPFAVSTRDTSYNFDNTTTGKRETQHQSAEYIHLRRQANPADR